MHTFKNVSPLLDYPRIYRQVSFDEETFGFLQETKRALAESLGYRLTNAGVLRVLLLSHPASAQTEESQDGEE